MRDSIDLTHSRNPLHFFRATSLNVAMQDLTLYLAWIERRNDAMAWLSANTSMVSKRP